MPKPVIERIAAAATVEDLALWDDQIRAMKPGPERTALEAAAKKRFEELTTTGPGA